uniref:BPTI/Kunitz inhibitor domain-containing protein n=1 Tax=Pseudonaja textilis TaxID=8673 RepID=A0A670ZP84_PSETE
MSFCPSAYQWWYATGLAWFERTGSKSHHCFSLTGNLKNASIHLRGQKTKKRMEGWGVLLLAFRFFILSAVETVLGFLLCFPEDCELPPDKGPADNLELRWFHNSKSKRCERFFYGGCYGNANNYKDINECDRCCVSPGEGRVWSEGGPLALVRSDQCQLPRNQGSCSKELQHFYYDPEEKKCISFVYHGCEGNSNNFPTRELCEKACGKISKGTEEACCIEVPAVLFPLSPKVCKLPADPGRCLAYSEQYYYNWNTKKCETFVYGMCNGNGNRFATKLECQMVCGEFGKEQA